MEGLRIQGWDDVVLLGGALVAAAVTAGLWWTFSVAPWVPLAYFGLVLVPMLRVLVGVDDVDDAPASVAAFVVLGAGLLALVADENYWLVWLVGAALVLPLAGRAPLATGDHTGSDPA